ncbi:MAG: IS701 family transposase, partial [Stackebrandtia sp.]
WALIDSAEPDRQYLVRRAIDDKELAFYKCYNPHRARFGELVNVAGARWPIEECFGAGKNEAGLDHYQVRTWDAWHRHIGFALLAHTFLAVTAHQTKKVATHRAAATPRNQLTAQTHRRLIPVTLAEIRRLLHLDRRDKDAVADGLRWSTWRRRHQADARRAHVRRHLQLQKIVI